mgnify:FL=1
MSVNKSGPGDERLSGNCLCGAITFTVDADGGTVGACHCKMCRRWSGGVLLALDSSNALQIDGEENLAIYKSSEWGERCFCKICGSNLFWRMQSSEHVSVMAGAINEEDQLTLGSQIFVDRKPGYFEFANETTNLTEADIYAKYAAPNQSTS